MVVMKDEGWRDINERGEMERKVGGGAATCQGDEGDSDLKRKRVAPKKKPTKAATHPELGISNPDTFMAFVRRASRSKLTSQLQPYAALLTHAQRKPEPIAKVKTEPIAKITPLPCKKDCAPLIPLPSAPTSSPYAQRGGATRSLRGENKMNIEH